MKYLPVLILTFLTALISINPLNAQCSIDAIDVQIDGDCNDTGMYNAILNVETSNATNDFYDIWINNEFYGYFPVENAPFSLENITPRSNSNYDIVQVCINDDPECCAIFEYEQPACGDCTFTIFELNTFNCSAVGVYDLQFIVNENEFDGDSFDLYANNTLLYNDEPINTYNPYPITNSNQEVDEIKICVSATDCCEIVEITPPNCDCNIVNDIILEETFCESSQFYQINLDYIDNGSEQFTLLVGNTPSSIIESVHNYSNLPITIGPINSLLWNNQTIVTVIDEVGDCSTSSSIGYETCEPVDCVILNVLPMNPMCNGDGTFNINIAVSQLNTGDEGYSVFVNGELEGSYFYNNTLSLINNLTSDTGDSHTIEVVDNEAQMCSFIYELAPVYCSDCAVTEILVSDVDCNEDGTYNAQLDVDISNATNEFIDVFINNEFYNFYAIADLPITLENITPRENADFEHIQVCVNDNPDCCFEFEYADPNCSIECDIDLEWLEIQPCNENGEVFVHLGVTSSNPNQFSFEITGNGNNYGTFDYGNTHYNIGPLPQDVPLEFIATDLNFENCTAVLEQTEVHCPNNDCIIGNAEITQINCNSDGTYNGVLTMDYQNATNEYFDLYINNEYSGFYPFSDLPLLLENITPRENSDDEHIRVCVNDNPNCCFEFEYADPNCTAEDDCIFTDLIVETLDCNENNQFMILVDIVVEDTITGSVGLLGNGENYGVYQPSDFPIELGPFSANTGVPYELIAYHNQNESCITTTFGQNCNDSQCYGFEAIEVGTTFNAENSNAGDIIFEFDDIIVQSDAFTYFDGTTDYFNIDIQTPNITPLNGNALWISNSTTLWDFSNTNLPVSQVTMTYWDGGGEVNLGVNGSNPVVLNDFSDLSTQLAPNVSIMGSDQSGGNGSPYGTLTFIGDIQSILIGGQEFYLDDICVEYALSPNPPMTGDVWPGDANNDNIANHFDVLNIGLAHGSTGAERENQTNEWAALTATDWDGMFLNETNYKHADCDGNGLVDDLDMIAINENYDLLHDGDEPLFEPIDINETDPIFYVELPDADNIIEGQQVEIPILLGSDDIPVEQIYGLAFTFKFSDGLFRNSDFEFDFSDGEFGGAEDVLTYHQSVAENNQIEVAITRKDQQNIILANGQIGHFIGIIDDLAGLTEVDVELINVVAIDVFENRIALNTPVSIVDLTTNNKQIFIENAVHIFPNPTRHYLSVQNKHQQGMETIQVVNLIGQTVLEFIPTQNNIQLDVSNFANGLYFLEINYDGAKHVQKFQVHR